MKLFAVLAICFAFANGLAPEVWPAGKEFVYEYKGRVIAGIPGIKEQLTGFGIKSIVKLQVVSPSTIVAKMTKLESGKLNREVPQARPEVYRAKVPMNWSPIEGEAEEVISQPFKINLRNGLITSLEVAEDEPIWSVNLKKGLATQLNVNLQQTNRIPFELRRAKKFEDKTFRHMEVSNKQQFFAVEEDSMGGNCKTVYTVVPLENDIAIREELDMPRDLLMEAVADPEMKPYIVTKVRDFDECDRQPSWVHMNMKDTSEQPCNPAQAMCHKFSTRSSITRFLLRKSPSGHHMRLEKVWGEHEFKVRPHGAKTEPLWSISNQTLTLLDESPISSHISLPKEKLTHTNLRYEFPIAEPEARANPRMNEDPVFQGMRLPRQQTLGDTKDKTEGQESASYGSKPSGSYGSKYGSKPGQYGSKHEGKKSGRWSQEFESSWERKEMKQASKGGYRSGSSSSEETSSYGSKPYGSRKHKRSIKSSLERVEKMLEIDNEYARRGSEELSGEKYYETKVLSTSWRRDLRAYYPTLRAPCLYMNPHTSSRLVRGRGASAKRQAEELLHEVVNEIENFEDLAEKQSALKVLQASRALSILSYDEIADVYNQVISSASSAMNQKTKKTLILDAIVMSGTHPAIMFVRDLIKKGELRGELAAQIVSTIPISVKAITPELISELIELVQSPHVKPSAQPRGTNQVWITTLLAIGNMINFGCVSPKTKTLNYPKEPRGAPLCSKNHPVVVNEFLPLLRRGLEQSEGKVWKKMIFIHALGNVGHPAVIKILEKCIQGETCRDPQVRTKAVFALTRVTEVAPSKVYKVLRPIYSNPKIHYSIRMAAFETLIHCHPSPAFFTAVATDTWFEPSQQVGSYVYSSLANLANNTSPIFPNISRMAEMALPLAKKFDNIGAQYSTNAIWANHVTGKGFGSLLQTTVFGSTKSLIPRLAYARIIKNVGGFKLDMAQGGIYAEGVQAVLNRVLRAVSPISSSEELFNAYNRVSETFSRGEPAFEAVARELNLKIKKDEPLNVAAWVKLFGGMERFVNLDYHSLIELISEVSPVITSSGKLGLNVKINYQKAFNPETATVVIPTPVGLPVYYSKKTPVLVSVRGLIEIESEMPNLSSRQLPQVGEIKIDLKPVITQNTLIEMGVVNPISQETAIAGVNTHNLASLPIKAKVKVNVPEKKLSFELESTKGRVPEKIDLLHSHQRPFTVIKKLGDFAPVNKVPQVKYIHVLHEPRRNKTVLGKELLGLPIEINTKQDRPYDDMAGRYWRMVKQNPVTVLVHALTPSSLRAYEVKVTVDTEKCETKRVIGHVQYSTSSNPKSIWSMEPESEIESKLFKHRSSHYAETEEDIVSFLRDPTPFWQQEEKLSYVSYFGKSGRLARRMIESQRLSKLRSDDEESSEEDESSRNLELTVDTEAKTQTLHAEVVLDGPAPRAYRASVHLTSNKDQTIRKLSAQVEKEGRHGAPYKAFVTGMIQYPKLPRTPAREALLQSDMTTLGCVTARFGRNAEHAIKAKVIMARSGSQRERAQESQAAKRCLADESKGLLYSSSCMEARQQATKLDKYIVDVQSENLPKALVNATYTMDSYIKYLLFPYMTLDPTARHHNPPNRVRAVIRVTTPRPSHPFTVVDVLTHKPHENAFFKTIKLSPVVEAVFPLSAKFPIVTKVLNKVLGNKFTPLCRVGEQSIQTFDNVTVKYPLPACFHVIAKDCSRPNGVTVLAKQAPQGEKIVKILMGTQEILVVPTPSSSPSRPSLMVKINGSPVTPMGSHQPHELREEGRVVLRIVKNNEGEVLVETPYNGIKVICNGVNVKVEASNMLRGRMCGLCGDFDGEKMGELKGPRGCIHVSPLTFGRSYAVPSEGCSGLSQLEPIEFIRALEQSRSLSSEYKMYERSEESELRGLASRHIKESCYRQIYEPEGEEYSVTAIRKAILERPSRLEEEIFGPMSALTGRSELRDADWESRSESSRPCVRYVTKVVQKGDKTCFSVKPIPECNLNCKPSKTISKAMGFHCVVTGELADKHMASARFGIVEEYVGRAPHFQSELSIPDACEILS